MAGDLMTPYAHYAAKPLPCPGPPMASVMFGKPHPIHPSARAEIAKDIKALTKKAVISNSVDKYVAVLSHTEWRTAKYLSEALCISSQAVTNYMRKKHMKKLVEKRTRCTGTSHYLVWRLK